ncbi:hypothetical protein PR048_004949 [Dryococelus australis]|uniref:DDE Tnp4 domain-containing protein n=1 Tax=Dryococelus australis TaxID=614101 RepID=A0ABQ9I6U4_9NEOP|nr:hypothetical protein PR048_004949 [Dryococelus australis]
MSRTIIRRWSICSEHLETAVEILQFEHSEHLLAWKKLSCSLHIVADYAFPLKPFIMKPFPELHNQCSNERIYNYRHCSARRFVKNVLGILAVVFRVLRKPLLLEPENAERVVLAGTHLSNFLGRNSTTAILVSGQWRVDGMPIGTLINLKRVQKKPSQLAKKIREEFSAYFNSSEGSLLATRVTNTGVNAALHCSQKSKLTELLESLPDNSQQEDSHPDVVEAMQHNTYDNIAIIDSMAERQVAKIILNAIEAKIAGARQLDIISPDTDVIVLALSQVSVTPTKYKLHHWKWSQEPNYTASTNRRKLWPPAAEWFYPLLKWDDRGRCRMHCTHTCLGRVVPLVGPLTLASAATVPGTRPRLQQVSYYAQTSSVSNTKKRIDDDYRGYETPTVCYYLLNNLRENKRCAPHWRNQNDTGKIPL